MLHFLTIKSPFNTLKYVDYNHEAMLLNHPLEKSLPLTYYYEDFLLSLIDIQDLIQLWTGLILEKSVIILS